MKVGDGISLTWRDVTERFRTRRRLREDAESDLPTGVAILYCDIDRFKEANDAFGHLAGDRILVAVADGIRRALRDGDVVARMGGDEFVVVLNGIRGIDEARSVAAKVARAVAVPVPLAGIAYEPRLSIGVAVLKPDEDPRLR